MSNKYPICNNCGSNSQVWINQLSDKLTCHRVGCHLVLIDELIPKEEESFQDAVKRRIFLWEIAEERASNAQPHNKYSILHISFLFFVGFVGILLISFILGEIFK